MFERRVERERENAGWMEKRKVRKIETGKREGRMGSEETRLDQNRVERSEAA